MSDKFPIDAPKRQVIKALESLGHPFNDTESLKDKGLDVENNLQ